MKKIKKILSSIIATATLISGTCFSVSISADYNCDVNGDGSVTTSDVAAISRYLTGNLHEPDYNIFDVNNSLTIDNMDAQCVLAEVMNYNYDCDYFSRATQSYTNAPSVSTITLNNNATSTVGLVYMRYSYAENDELSSYILRPSTSTLNSNSRQLIGEDDRYLATGSENCGIVRLNTGCTGFIVDDHHIATNAHAVYNKEDSIWKDVEYVETYNENGTLSGTRLTPVEAHFPISYLTNGEYDYALITVEEDLSDYIHFDLGTSYSVTSTNFANIPIYVTGCPGAGLNGVGNSSHLLHSAEGRVTHSGNNLTLKYDADTMPGNSGSPVYTITRNIVNNQPSYTYTALAIHYAGIEDNYNVGSLITKYHLQFYKNNPNANY